jgi:hypothetical protein
MRRCILAGSAALFLAAWTAPVRGAVVAAPARVGAETYQGRAGTPRQADAEAWLLEEALDRLTIPLGPADRNIWPLGTGRELWIGTAPTFRSHRAPLTR